MGVTTWAAHNCGLFRRAGGARQSGGGSVPVAQTATTFVNEYISKADSRKYELVTAYRAQGPSQQPSDRRFQNWTIDRGRNAFLIETTAQRGSAFSGHAFYWKGAWVFFKMCPTETRIDARRRSCWFRYVVTGMAASDGADLPDELLTDLKNAITASFGGVGFDDVQRSATIEFVDS